MAAMLASCGGGDGSSAPSTVPLAGGVAPPTAGPAPAPAPPSGTCSLRSRQLWVAEQMDLWYLFPETLPANLDPAPFPTVQSFIDRLTQTARQQGRDRFFTFITSIEQENAFFASGSSAGIGIRLAFDSAASRAFIIDAFEGAPGLAAGLDRGTELLAIGTTSANLRSVSAIFAEGGAQAVSAALGPSTAGSQSVLRVRSADGSEFTTTVIKREFSLVPISSRFGVRVLDDGGKKVGYVNLRTFIGSADGQLRSAFAQFRAEGISEFILDLRYNGGGLVRTAELFGDLLGRNRFGSDIFSITAFRASQSQFNETRNFDPQPQSVAPTKIAVIATSSTASASELVTNSFIPYLNADLGLIGSNTSGKPVGQIGLDREECDDRLRVVAFQTQNADGEGDYFNGLANAVDSSCQAPDDFLTPLGNPNEASIAQALGFLRGESCTPINAVLASGGAAAQSNQADLQSRGALNAVSNRRELLMPDVPTPAQREVPGLF